MNSGFGCQTTEGFITYPKHPTMNFHLPVALDFSVKASDDVYPPFKENGELVYVLPGGNKTTLSDLGIN